MMQKIASEAKPHARITTSNATRRISSTRQEGRGQDLHMDEREQQRGLI